MRMGFFCFLLFCALQQANAGLAPPVPPSEIVIAYEAPMTGGAMGKGWVSRHMPYNFWQIDPVVAGSVLTIEITDVVGEFTPVVSIFDGLGTNGASATTLGPVLYQEGNAANLAALTLTWMPDADYSEPTLVIGNKVWQNKADFHVTVAAAQAVPEPSSNAVWWLLMVCPLGYMRYRKLLSLQKAC